MVNIFTGFFRKKIQILAFAWAFIGINTASAQPYFNNNAILKGSLEAVSPKSDRPISKLLESGKYGEAINLAVRLESKYGLAESVDSTHIPFYLDYANLMETMLQIEDAVAYKKKALNTGTLSPTEEIIVRTSIAKNLIALNQHDEALAMVNGGLAVAEKAKNNEAIRDAYESIALVYKELNEFDLGLSYQKKCIEMFMMEPQMSKGDSIKYGAQLGTLGELFLKKAEFDSSIVYLQRDVDISLSTQSLLAALSGHINLSRAYGAKNDSDQAFSHAITAYNLATTLGHERSQLRSLDRIVELMGSFGHPTSYASYLTEFHSHVQQAIEKKYKAQSLLKSGMSKAVQKKSAALEEAKATQDRLMKTILWLFGLISLMLFTILFYVLIRFRRSMAQKENEEKRQKEILRMQIKQTQKDLGKASLELERKSSLSTNIVTHLEKISSLTTKDRNQLILFLKNELGLFNTNYDSRHYSETAQLFLDNLLHKHHNLTENDKELSTLIVIGMSNKEMATALNIQSASVKVSKNRLKKKLNLNKDQSLSDYLLSFVHV